MKEKPILFSAPMVRAILDGRKVQTRRLIRERSPYLFVDDEPPRLVAMDKYGDYHDRPCPFGAPGDRLWVRETWGIRHTLTRAAYYRATESNACKSWRPSIHMPRWASRIDLEITAVRVERLQAIAEEDARAEGVDPVIPIGCNSVEHRAAFQVLWDSINGKRASWESNPWVWVLSFKRVRP